MLRLLYLLARQRAHLGRAVPPATGYRGRNTLIAAAGVLLACAAIAGVALLQDRGSAAAPPGASNDATATLQIRVDAIDSAPVVVFLETPGQNDRDAPEAAPETVRITSVNNAFQPAFQVASVATRVEVANGDPVPHNTHLFAGQRSVFNVATPTSGVRVQKVLGRSGILDVRCDFHPWMHAWIFVPPSAHHAVIWQPGQVTLRDITPGSYRLQTWTPARGKVTHTLRFDGGETKSLALTS